MIVAQGLFCTLYLIFNQGKLECADESVAQRNLRLNVESGIKPWLRVALSQKQEESVVFLDTHMEAREEPLPGGVRNIMEGHIVLKLVGEVGINYIKMTSTTLKGTVCLI